MHMSLKDKIILQELGKKYAEIAHLDQQQTNITNWQRLNSLSPGAKPMVMIDQLPWHELNSNDELTLQCEDPFCRSIENHLRQTLYKWTHMATDMVVMPYIGIGKVISSTGIGISIDEEIGFTDKNNDVVAHKYSDSLADEEALAKIHPSTITYDEALTHTYLHRAEEIFKDILPVKLTGVVPGFRVWDELTMYRGVTPLLLDMMDRPEFIHAIMEKLTQIELDILTQYEQLGLLDPQSPTVHCSGTFTTEMTRHAQQDVPATAKDCWAYGMGQIFSSCSPAMHDEFEIAYAKRYYERCGLVYYGCCEPLHQKIDIIRKLPHVRKISMSPWADVEVAAANIKRDYVLSRKPNPALLAPHTMDEDAIKKEIIGTLKACEAYGTPCEFILKDVSTVNYKPERLFKWSQLVGDIIANY
ncbi:MAG: hypothetical protein ACRCW2_04320 [Cellulosilyticaceae bacterium]